MAGYGVVTGTDVIVIYDGDLWRCRSDRASLCTSRHRSAITTASTTMTIKVTAETKERLGQLALETRRSRSFLAAEAVNRDLDREQAIIDGIKRGRTDVAAGRLVSNDAAFAELTATIVAAGSERDR